MNSWITAKSQIIAAWFRHKETVVRERFTRSTVQQTLAFFSSSSRKEKNLMKYGSFLTNISSWSHTKYLHWEGRLCVHLQVTLKNLKQTSSNSKQKCNSEPGLLKVTSHFLWERRCNLNAVPHCSRWLLCSLGNVNFAKVPADYVGGTSRALVEAAVLS